jgi:predicted nuclease of predicted toxin-antitoxin system
MKLLLDACMPLDWLGFLCAHGYDCLAWVRLGPPNAPDSDIMRYAREQGRVVLTHDLDFGRLLAFSKATHPSVIQFRASDIRPAALGPQLLQALRTHEPVLRQGALITVEADRARSRILPLDD